MKDIYSKQEIEKCSLIYGNEEWLISEYMKEVHKKTISADDLMNYQLFEGKEVEVNKLIDAANTLPFFAGYKLLVIRESGLFKAGKKDETTTLVKWLDQIPDYLILIFIEKEVDKRNSLYKAINKQYHVKEMNCPKDDELVKIIKAICQEKQLSIGMAELHYFIQNMPPSIHYMQGELDKLKGYCGSEMVTREAIRAVCIFSLEQRVFEMLREMNKHNVSTALEIYNRLIESKESPIGILVLIARQYRILLQIKYLLKNNVSVQQVAEKLKLPSFVIKESAKDANGFTFKELEERITWCLESDVSIKTGKMEQIKCIQLLIIRCSYKETSYHP